MPYQAPDYSTLRALETAPNIYLILSPDLCILTASDLFLEATNTNREAITGKHIFEAFPDNPDLPDADGVQNINASLQIVLETKKPHYMRIQRYDVPDIENPGQFIQRYWHPSHTPVFTKDGAIHYIIQLANNVTNKVLTEEALTRQATILENLAISETHFRHLADIVPAKISNALPTGEVTFFNQKWLDYAGMNFEDMRDFGYHQMMHPEEIPAFQVQLAAAAAKGVALESEMRFKDINGNYRWHLNIASPILNEKGEITMWVGSTTDIQRIKEEEQRKSDFIGMVSHELKTPLTSLNAYLQMLQAKAKKAADTFTLGALDQSLKQVKRMTAMITGFLDVSRLDSGKIYIDKQRFDMAGLIKEAEAETIPMYSSHQIFFAPAEDTVVTADRDKIGQVINNLISNAVKYSKPASTINVGCLVIDGFAVVSVKDEGIGIEAKEINRLFEMYYRVEGNAHISGFGIGLYLCYEIIKRHQGKIWAESEPGKGSTFFFSLPVYKKD